MSAAEHRSGAAPAPYESPSPLRSTAVLRDTVSVFRETLAAVDHDSAAALRLRTLDGGGGRGAAAFAGEVRLFPADGWQMRACVDAAHARCGVVYGCRAPVPDLTDVNDELMFATGYRFRIGVDDLVREGCDGYLISYGDAVHACLDVVDALLAAGTSIGLIAKPTLDVPDEDTLKRLGSAPVVLLVEALEGQLGLDDRLRAWLDEHGFRGSYDCIGPGMAGQGVGETPDPARIHAALARLLDARRKPGSGPAPGPEPRLARRALSREGLLAEAARCVRLAGPEHADLPAPKTLGPLDRRLAAKLGPFRFETPFAAEVRDARLAGPQAVGFTAAGQPILETAANRIDVLGRSLSRMPAGLEQAPATARLPLACSLVDLWSPLYAHWLLEGLTRLEAWDAFTEAAGERPALIIDRDPPRWMRDSLRLMGVDPDACIQWQGGPVEVERLVICSRRRERGRVSARALERVRERVLAGLPAAPSPGPRRIFITRADSRFRQVQNEHELLAGLAPLGFERVRLSDMPWPEQIRLFRDVEAVVAAHGAGMTNILFSTRRPMVVELFGQKVSHMNYTVGLGTGCDHRVLCCAPDGDDLRVDVAALRRLIEA